MLSFDVLERNAPPDASWLSLLRALFVRSEWLLRPMLEMLEEPMLPAYFADFTDIWNVMRAIRPEVDEATRVDEAIRGLQFHSIEFLKLQIQFAKKGEYRSSDFEAVYKEVYNAPDVMKRYLDGLLLTYVAWPNHYRLLQYYRRNYLAKGPYGNCLEIGPGHGWLALEQLRASPTNRLLGLDISPSSVQYTNSVLKAAGIEPARFQICEHNAMTGIDAAKPFDRVVIAEVIEHLEKPDELLRLAVSHSHKQTLFFITTVVNIEAVDHIYLFRELHEIPDLLRSCGLSVIDQLDLPLKMNLQLPKPAYEVAVIARPS